MAGLLLIAASAASCSDDKTELETFRMTDGSLARANKAINRATEEKLLELEEKQMEPATKGKAAIWHPKAQQVVELTRNFHNDLEQIKQELKEKAGLKKRGDVELLMKATGRSQSNFSEKRGRTLLSGYRITVALCLVSSPN